MALTYRTVLRRTAPLLALALILAPGLTPAPAGAIGGVGDLYVTSDASNMVRAYNGGSGNYLGIHSSAGLGAGQLALHFGATNNRMLVGSFGGGVDEYNAVTGAYIKTYSPGGGFQWAGLYAANGNVLISSQTTNDVREYDFTTGAFVGVFCSVPGPADMRIGPNGNLYVCSYTGNAVMEFNGTTGAFVSQWFMPVSGPRPNDIAFLPSGEILVTVMGLNVCYRFDSSHNPLGSFAGTGWERPHGIDISPADGRIYVVDGVTTQVHVFDPVTFAELNAGYLTPNPGDKIVDLEFRRDTQITPVERTTWSRLKALFP